VQDGAAQGPGGEGADGGAAATCKKDSGCCDDLCNLQEVVEWQMLASKLLRQLFCDAWKMF